MMKITLFIGFWYLSCHLIAFAQPNHGSSQSAPCDTGSPEIKDLYQKLTAVPDHFYHYLLTSRMADAYASMAIQTLEHRWASHNPEKGEGQRELPVSERLLLHQTLGKGYLYQGKFEKAGNQFELAARYDPKETSKTLAHGAAWLGGLETHPPTGDKQALRALTCMSRGKMKPDPRDKVEESESGIEALYYRFLSGEPIRNPVAELTLPDFEGFSYYHPWALSFLSEMLFPNLEGDSRYQMVVDLIRKTRTNKFPNWSPGPGMKLEDTYAYLALAVNNHPSSAKPDSCWAPFIAEQDGPFGHLLGGYLAFWQGDRARAYQEMEQFVLEQSFTSLELGPRWLIFMDFVRLGYHLGKASYSVQWIMDRPQVSRHCPYLNMPRFYLVWMSRESLTD